MDTTVEQERIEKILDRRFVGRAVSDGHGPANPIERRRGGRLHTRQKLHPGADDIERTFLFLWMRT